MYPFTSLQLAPPGRKVRRVAGPVAMKDSVTLGKVRSGGLSDAGLFMSRSFRVGWGPSWLLAHSGDPIGGPLMSTDRQQQQPDKGTKTTAVRLSDGGVYKVHVERVAAGGPTATRSKEEQRVDEEPLEISLSHCEVVAFPDGAAACPLARPRQGAAEALLRAYNLWIDPLAENQGSSSRLLTSWRDTWSLAEALWGPPEALGAILGPLSQYREQLVRKRRFSAWLAGGARRAITAEEKEKSRKKPAGAEMIFSLLTANRIGDACKLAQSIGDHRLALLLSQAAGGRQTRDMLSRQLADWSDRRADCFVSEERLRIFALLAGKPVWQASKRAVNVCSGLDWRRCVAVHLWFVLPPTASVSDALGGYEAAFQGTPAAGTDEAGSYARAPLPPYYRQEWSVDDKKKRPFYDVCFHLLKLYGDRHYPLETLLDPRCATADPLDYRLSWHLWTALASMGYGHLSVRRQCLLHSSYAALLESHGRWRQAVAVLLHIPDHAVRERAVRDALCRHCEEEEEEGGAGGGDNRLLKERLFIPARWLAEARAVRARSLNRADREALHLLRAGLWNQCHKLVIRTLASDCIVNGDPGGFLLEILEGLSEPPDRRASVQNWDSAGRVYLDYLRLLKPSANKNTQLECLFGDVKSLRQRIELLPCRSAKDRLARSEMARRLADVLREALASPSNGDATAEEQLRLLAPPPLSRRQPTNEVYALDELHSLSQSYLTQLIGGQ